MRKFLEAGRILKKTGWYGMYERVSLIRNIPNANKNQIIESMLELGRGSFSL